MDGNGFLIFLGIVVKVLIFTASIFTTTFLVDLTSTGKYRWVPAFVIGPSILILAIYPGLILSILRSFPAGVSWNGITLVILGGVAAGGALSGV